MDPTSGAIINPADLTSLLASGGNTAAIFLVYVGFKLKTMVQKYIETQIEMMQSVISTNEKIQKSQTEITTTLELVKTKIGV
jgi:hypothetical protein